MPIPAYQNPLPRRLRVLLIAGSNRLEYNCPGVDSKARTLLNRLADRLPATWDIDTEDLGNVNGRPKIQSCNACVSTSMALCVWPCNCYEKNSRQEPDLMWNLDLYSRLDQANAWCIIGPVNWYGPTSTLKLMFDRLVCMNGGNPDESLIDHKNPEKAIALEHKPEWESLSLNHLEGRTAAFFCYGDGGGDELDETGRPKILRHKNYFDPAQEPFENMRDAYAPLVGSAATAAWKCPTSSGSTPKPATAKSIPTTRPKTWCRTTRLWRSSTSRPSASARPWKPRARCRPGATAPTATRPPATSGPT